MRKFIFIFVALQIPHLQAEPQKAPRPKEQPWLKDQQDQTDTLAIPSDSSEEEEEDEMKELQQGITPAANGPKSAVRLA